MNKSSTSDSDSDCYSHSHSHSHRHSHSKERLSMLRRQMLSLEYLVLLAYFSVQSTWITFYFGTVDTQVRSKSGGSGDSEYDTYVTLFTIINPCTAFLVPLVGRLMDTHGTFIMSVATACFGLAFAVASLAPWLWTQVFTFIFLALCNTCLFPTVFTTMMTYFGFTHFGMLSGALFLVSGLLNLLAYPLTSLVTKQLDGDYTIVNVAQLVCFVAFFAFPRFLYVHRRAGAETILYEPISDVPVDC
eukprot:TRINITY_DN6390_c0_g1::TRINITY_DN6390_c0_g1_i1::g.537::m.537 TRINITY_DN6390_c0_g1::TRINITY_DN6390_c0_g1_i1::g.537  ORF type:complete len:245 (-),score=37.16,sp/Q8NBI5/S43A3_HUMAN/24.11/4e-06,MFS_1/PF07690.11/9.7e-06,DUF1230/PF06799.6/46,DUF1230/PF06799.6/7.5 TRINITY_DN6390_c0_g1_i1:50-784(-)